MMDTLDDIFFEISRTTAYEAPLTEIFNLKKKMNKLYRERIVDAWYKVIEFIEEEETATQRSLKTDDLVLYQPTFEDGNIRLNFRGYFDPPGDQIDLELAGIATVCPDTMAGACTRIVRIEDPKSGALLLETKGEISEDSSWKVTKYMDSNEKEIDVFFGDVCRCLDFFVKKLGLE